MIKKMSTEKSIGHSTVNDLYELGIRAIPPCYESWYYYKSGSDNSIARAIKDHLSQYDKINEEELIRIKDNVENNIEISNKIPELLRQLSFHAENIKQYGENYANNNKQLREDLADSRATISAISPDDESLDVILSTIVAELDRTQERNRDLAEKLQSSLGQIVDLKLSLKWYQNEVYLDPLTKIYNRRFFDQKIEQSIQSAFENDTPLVMLICDVDHFKSFNDTYGHDIGDQLLRFTANTIKANTKGKDIVARYGGDEFVILLTETNCNQGEQFAEMLRKTICQRRLKSKTNNTDLGHLTLTIGGAEIMSEDTPASLFRRADEALYEAKRQGRNCVCMASNINIDSKFG